MPAEQWTARMIAPDQVRDSAPLLRRVVVCDTGHGAVVSAEVLATGLGIIEVAINGRPASADVLTPGWTSYEWRLRYARWQVRELIEPTMLVEILIGAGWHCGRLGFAGGRALYGDRRAALLELRIEFEDGHRQTVVTDESWESGTSQVTADDLYDGETIDARRANGAEWSAVEVLDIDHDRLVPFVAPPVRRTAELSPQRIWTSTQGETIVDFGQNLVGWVRLDVEGESGREVVVRHAEVLEHGELGTRPLRTAEATDRFILADGPNTFEPTLTLHGFRYAGVSGWPGTIDQLQSAITAIVVGSDLRRIGRFECSDPLLNRLHSNIVWSMRGNFVSVPTDCPQRDERLGWTGDLAAFVATAVFLYDTGDFLRDWLRDLAAEQSHVEGMIPLVVPDNFKLEHRYGMRERLQEIPDSVAALWNDAAAWVPQAAWQAYGDTEALAEAYPSMTAYGRRIARATAVDGIVGGLQFGDWLDPDAPDDQPSAAKADQRVVATACAYRSVCMIRDAAEELGCVADAQEFAALALRLRAAFAGEFVKAGRLRSDAPTVYALAIVFGLLDEPDRTAAGDRLAELVRLSGHRIATGFAGTPFLTRALSETGHVKDAYALLMQTECPSWLYPVTMNATTIWERWDSMLPDGSINPGEMTSFNHYAFGAIGEWMHSVVAGISPLEPGYRRIRVAPRPGGGLTWAAASIDTPSGIASVSWRLEERLIVVDLHVPPATTALICIEGLPETTVEAGNHTFRAPAIA